MPKNRHRKGDPGAKLDAMQPTAPRGTDDMRDQSVLRVFYEPIVSEPLPGRLLVLLSRLSRRMRGRRE